MTDNEKLEFFRKQILIRNDELINLLKLDTSDLKILDSEKHIKKIESLIYEKKYWVKCFTETYKIINKQDENETKLR